MVHSVSGGRQKVSAKAEKVPIAGVEASDRAGPHVGDLMGDRDARDGRATEVVVGDQESVGDIAEGCYLMTNVFDIWSSGWFDLAENAEAFRIEKGGRRRGGRRYARSKCGHPPG
jgi:hypothetical protein